ncbi:MAG: hypothetical protein ACK5TA_06490, partial [bacterium]
MTPGNASRSNANISRLMKCHFTAAPNHPAVTSGIFASVSADRGASSQHSGSSFEARTILR